MRNFKHFTRDDRLKLEMLLRVGKSAQEIADILHKHVSSIYREKNRGKYEHLNTDYTTEERYSPDIAEEKYRANLAAKGADLKIGADLEFSQYIESRIIKDKYSPAAVLGEIKAEGLAFNTSISVSTLYSYIEKGIFLHLTNKNLPVKGKKKKRHYNRVKQKRRSAGESIENRPDNILTREEFGHWEMDCVEGAKRTHKTLLMLSERKTRDEIVIPIKAKTAEYVIEALNSIEKNYRSLFPIVFKTITVDNGSEFSDVEGMEKSIFGGKRTKFYYCHAYSSWERGTNENINKMARRHYPKGTNFENVPDEELLKLNEWINNYPRKIFDYKCSAEMFNNEMASIL